MPMASTVIEIGDIRNLSIGRGNRVNVAPRPSGAVTTVLLGRLKFDRSHHAGYREYVDAIPPQAVSFASDVLAACARAFQHHQELKPLRRPAHYRCMFQETLGSLRKWNAIFLEENKVGSVGA
jgi:hypothetical protein